MFLDKILVRYVINYGDNRKTTIVNPRKDPTWTRQSTAESRADDDKGRLSQVADQRLAGSTGPTRTKT